MVGTLALTEMTSWGIVYYGFGVMLLPMQRELGWSRAELTGAFSLALLVSGIAGVPIGRLLDRYGARGVMTLGSCAATLLVLAWSRVHSLAGLYAVWIGLGLAMAAILYEPAFAVVAAWFTRRRHHALTILTFGGGLASVVYVPLATWLLERYGWRSALGYLAAILALGTIPLHALLLRRHPPRAEPAFAPSVSQAALPASIPLHTALRERRFWWIAAAFALSIFSTIAITVHLLTYLAERGYSPGFAASVAGLMGASQLPGRLLFAPLGARARQQLIAAGLCALQATALVVLVVLPTTAGVLVFAALFGASSGALTTSRAALVADVYGAAHYGSINGTLSLFVTAARALAPLGVGLLYEAAGSYTPVLWLMVGLTAAGAGAVLVSGRAPEATLESSLRTL
jgi:MFS family permease